MNKILLLGGSAQQVVAIKTAKKMGYYTILCDYLQDNPGQYCADKFYLVSTTDKEKVLEIAQKEKVVGVLAYASDPAAPTAAYVAERLNLPGFPYEATEILCNKDRFREFLRNNGFNTPKAAGFSNSKEALAGLSEYKFPIIIKPVDSSGSKGTTVVRSVEQVGNAIEFAFSFSRNHRIIIEEYIEKAHKYLIGGDIFIVNGKIVLWGLLNCHRDNNVNLLVPVGKSYPLDLAADIVIKVKETLQKLVEKLNLKNGALNVELVADKNNQVWPIDIGPRNGGNMIPDLLGYIFNIDVIEMSIRAAVGENLRTTMYRGTPFYATHNLHVSQDGIFQKVRFSKEIESHILKTCIYKTKGDYVEYFDNASKAVGVVFLKFDSQQQMREILDNINLHIQVCIEPYAKD